MTGTVSIAKTQVNAQSNRAPAYPQSNIVNAILSATSHNLRFWSVVLSALNCWLFCVDNKKLCRACLYAVFNKVYSWRWICLATSMVLAWLFFILLASSHISVRMAPSVSIPSFDPITETMWWITEMLIDTVSIVGRLIYKNVRNLQILILTHCFNV